MILKGTRGSDLLGLFALSRQSTAQSQIQSICLSQLGTTFASITPSMIQACKNALLSEFVGSLNYGTDEGLLMADAATMGWALGLSIFGGAGAAPKCIASGSGLGAFAGYVARDTCCGLDKEAIIVSAVFSAIASCETSSASQQVTDLQTAWNNWVTLDQGS